VEGERPEVTVVDPAAPAGAEDLLAQGGEKPPWRLPVPRLSPFQKVVLVLVVAILGTLTGATTRVVHVRHERVLDREARDAVAVSVVDPELNGSASSELDLLYLQNDGPNAVHVTWVSVEGAGYQGRGQHVTIAPQHSLPVAVEPSTTCDPSLYTDRPTFLLVRLLTHRGDEVRRRLPLPLSSARVLNRQARTGCGLTLPEEALSVQMLVAVRAGRVVQVEWSFTNTGPLPLTIDRAVVPPGLSLQLDLPLTIPAEADAQGLVVRGRLTASDCASLLAFASTDGSSGFGAVGVAHVRHQFAEGDVLLPLDGFTADGTGVGFELSAVALAVSTCPGGHLPSGDEG
jgi:hypothetical protein